MVEIISSGGTLIISDNIFNTYKYIKGEECGIIVYNIQNDNFNPIRTLKLYHIRTGNPVIFINSNTLNSGSTSYSSDMDIYANNLINILYPSTNSSIWDDSSVWDDSKIWVE